MAKNKTPVHVEEGVESDEMEDSSSEIDEKSEDRLSGSDADSENEDDLPESEEVPEKSAMASVVARILSKDISKSNRVLLAKGKTDKEILQDISERKRAREKSEEDPTKPKQKKRSETGEDETDFFKEEKRKIWESMARKIPSVLDLPKETKLRKIATQGMVQLFRSVHEHQKVMKQKLSSVGASERKKDKVMSEFTKGKFLDLLKGKESKTDKKEGSGKWKILQDDYMMGAQMKDWDKEDPEDGSDLDQENPMEDDVLSDND
ncbi:RRP15-like protein [Aplysia californica]|uniref:RRP15-like protein n=1 Tax=Aplysia californica TaxID=6500 RepID=A0ABM0K1Y3_APLCA|nr:RRP15-like protein [Aplysia californica]